MWRLHGDMSGVARLGGEPYSLRHGGASHDSLTRRRSYADRKLRGRWRTDMSVRRYDKHARLIKEVSRLTDRTRQYGAEIERGLNDLLRGTRRPPPPPYVDGRGLWRSSTESAGTRATGRGLKRKAGDKATPLNPMPGLARDRFGDA